MRNTMQIKKYVMACVLLFTAFAVHATDDGNTKTFGDFDVHYSVFPSTFLDAKIAQAYQIPRAKNETVINIAVRKRLANGKDQAHAAIMAGTSSDLIHDSPLAFQEIREQDTVYYVAHFRHSQRQLTRFDISIQPDPNLAAFQLQFSKELFVDE